MIINAQSLSFFIAIYPLAQVPGRYSGSAVYFWGYSPIMGSTQDFKLLVPRRCILRYPIFFHLLYV